MKLYTHIGADRLIRNKDIIGFFDLDGALTPEITGEFLKKAESSRRTSSAGRDLPRSFVLVSEKASKSTVSKRTVVIFSHISSSSLVSRVKREENMGFSVEPF